MTEDELAEIEERAAKATPGPWESGISRHGDGYIRAVDSGDFSPPWDGFRSFAATRPGHSNDAGFIAAARSDVPALIAEVRRLRAALLLVEFGSCDGCGNKHRCIECGAHGVQDFDPETFDPLPLPWKPEPHKPNCPIGKALGREPSDQ